MNTYLIGSSLSGLFRVNRNLVLPGDFSCLKRFMSYCCFLDYNIYVCILFATVTATRTSSQNTNSNYCDLFGIIPTPLICQVCASYPRMKLVRTALKFVTKMKNSCCCFAVEGKKCTKIYNAPAFKLLFCGVLVAIVVAIRLPHFCDCRIV